MKSPGLAAVLSFFFCGLGQIYNGQILKGRIFLVAYFISWMMTWIVIGFITTPLCGSGGLWMPTAWRKESTPRSGEHLRFEIQCRPS